MDKEKEVHNLLSKKYTYSMLKSLDKEPRRFGDLTEACRSEKMRTQRLKEFEGLNLIKVKSKRIGRRSINFYELSETGKGTLKLAEEMRKLHERK